MNEWVREGGIGKEEVQGTKTKRNGRLSIKEQDVELEED